MKIEIKSTQIIDEKEETIIQKGIATIANYEKGTVLAWEIPKEMLHFQMTILENKILLKKPNQTMTFEQGKTTSSNLQTPYGNLNMDITTNHMEIIKENEIIKKIILDYEIQIQDSMKYQNNIEIIIKEEERFC